MKSSKCGPMLLRLGAWVMLCGIGWAGSNSSCLFAAETEAGAHFRSMIEPLLTKYCYDCHGYGEASGNVALDAFTTDDQLTGNPQLWWRALSNVRAGVMPPVGEAQPDADEKKALEHWVKYQAFGLDPKNPDPGRVTLRRLNRTEYRNTIRDLTGYDFKAFEEFPPDDTGYGFDNIGDVLSVSPLLLEKYMQAAETIVAAAVPTTSKVTPEQTVNGKQFRTADRRDGNRLTFYDSAAVSHTFKVPHAAEYRLILSMNVEGAFNFDPGRATVIVKVDDQQRWKKDLGWGEKVGSLEFKEQLSVGEHRIAIELEPLVAKDKKQSSVDLNIARLKIEGPLEEKFWSKPKDYDRFFTMDVPTEPAAKREYARELISKFAKNAFRRPVEDRTVDRLLVIAEESYNEPGKTFEHGLSRAMVAVLSSPRFIFRLEGDIQETPAEPFPLVDEYSLAARLSYFLWSTTPDQELMDLADRGELRKNLPAQIKRLLADGRAEALVENFTGQWLQVRDVEGVSIDARAVMLREIDPADRNQFAGRNRQRDGQPPSAPEVAAIATPAPSQGNQVTPHPPADAKPAPLPERPQDNRPIAETPRPADGGQPPGGRRFRTRIRFDRELKVAMRQETEMQFGYLLREDRSALELLDSDYTFLNERLAKHYGIPEVFGEEMRRVTLPPDSPRGGILTQGSVLAVTSNPTRTSPVKRGLFILENVIGTPPPPPPANVPDLEEAAKTFEGREPSLREVLELHRSNVLCSSCHSRMDPLGLALDNFNALGMWRDKELGQAIDPAGKLITGEAFQNIRELKRILKDNHRVDFYRCLTEKMLTYAVGRGLDYYDVQTVDEIVEHLEQENGRMSVLLTGVIESAPFQKRRSAAAPTADPTKQQASNSVPVKTDP